MHNESFKLDADEQEFVSSYENDEWVSVKNLKKEIVLAKKAAKNTLDKRSAAGHPNK